MHPIDYIALSLFLVAHIGTTICIGLWLNKMARREVQAAVNNVANGLAERFPILNGLGGIMSQAARLSQSHQDDGRKVTQ